MSMNRTLERTLLAAISLGAVVLTSCGTVKEVTGTKEVEYKSSRTVSPLEIPPGLSSVPIEPGNAIPGGTSAQKYAARGGQQAAASARVLPNPANARIERSGNVRWLVVDGDAEAVWGRIYEFWLQQGMVVAVNNPQTGVMETDWAERRTNITSDTVQALLSKAVGTQYSAGLRDKYRTRVERGTTPGTTDIYISHRGMVERLTADNAVDPLSTYWTTRPSDPELEIEMLRRMLVFLGVEPARAGTVVAAAAAAPASARASIGAGDGKQKVLTLQEPFDSGWRRVGLALDRTGFTVEDRDRSNGVYFVRYIDPDTDGGTAKKGFFSRLFSGKDKRDLDQFNYRVKVEAAGNATRVSVLDKAGAPEATGTGDRILTLLLDQLK